MPSSDTSRLRPKPQLPCTPCRRSKVKCNRGHLCTRCLVRGLADSCSYQSVQREDEAMIRPAPTAATIPLRPSTMNNMGSCIDELEMLIRSLKRSSKSGAGTVAGGEEDLRWAAALDRIFQLKSLLDGYIAIVPEQDDARILCANTLPALHPLAPIVEPRETPYGDAEGSQSAHPRRRPNSLHKMYFYVPDAFGMDTSAPLPVGKGGSAK